MSERMKSIQRHMGMYEQCYGFAALLPISSFAINRSIFDRGSSFWWATGMIWLAATMRPGRPVALLIQRTIALIGFAAAVTFFPNVLKLAYANPDIWAWLFMTSVFTIWWIFAIALNPNRIAGTDEETRKLLGKKLGAYLLICLAFYYGADFVIGTYKRQSIALISTPEPGAFSVSQALTWKLNMAENAALIGSLVLFCFFSMRVMRAVNSAEMEGRSNEKN